MALSAAEFPIGKMFSLNDKVAVVTGGTRGLGLSAACGLLLAGCSTVIVTSRKAAACSESKKILEELATSVNRKVRVEAIPADLARFEEVERFTNAVKDIVGSQGVDILIANAGATWGAPFDDHPDSAFGKVMDLNVKSVFNIIRLMTPLLTTAAKKDDPSRVITLGSVAGIVIGATNSKFGTYGYSASKAAVIHLTKNLAVELGPRNILVNCVAPGFFPSKMADGLIGASGGISALEKKNPNGRLGRAEDIAGVIVFLCSKASGHVNGIILPLDGGKNLDINGAVAAKL